MKRFPIFLFIVLITAASFPQTETEWFPAELNIQPFTASFLEPRAGFQYLFDIEKVQINIGTSHDLLQFTSEDKIISFGADFFTYTRARKEGNFKFPVETIDYLFGINSGYRLISEKTELGFRLRFSHISAHLADGLYNSDTDEWADGEEPFVYSREFFELMSYYKLSGVRLYVGAAYNIHTIPSNIKNLNLQIGFDYFIQQLRTSSFTPFIAYDFKLNGAEEYFGNNSVLTGIKFANPDSRGFSIFAGYSSGKSNHGEFFNLSENYFTIGMNLDI